MSILLTGGAGFIGSHTAVELIGKLQARGQQTEIVAVDNLYNAQEEVMDRIAAITGVRPVFVRADVADREAMEDLFSAHPIQAVIHFAGYKAVGESVSKPVAYYRNNLDTTLTLLETMARHGCRRIIFSSSATVYSAGDKVPFTEETKELGCTNPYGWTKYMIEQILRDAAAADPELSVVLLRYFNPIGAHPSGLLGERPNGIPNNLMPYLTQVAAGIRDHLSVFGTDYPTPDGTGVRDYIHVVDLARGHAAALDYAMTHTGCETFNLGTGVGYSVLDIVRAFEQANQVKIPCVMAPRRPGDIATCYAATEKARRMLGWQAELTLEDMCRDSWRWQQREMEG